MSNSRPHSTSSDGLSRRGWIVFVATTVVVLIALTGAAAIALGASTDSAHTTTAPAQGDQLRTPPAAPAAPTATPRGLPARADTTPAATAPSRPIGSLTSGDCLQTYPSQSADSYPVVDCASPHLAQVLWTGELPQPPGAAFPGTDALQTQIGDLCQQHLDWDWVAVWNEDVQIDERYPDSATAWASGGRTYYCFVYTYSRHELTGSALAR
ncbi:septum formation family protein [uncultured Leifsonia sp.]|uniref:septum formation family protein n=1 Tax=uncultured Leifsonia sp. TaxID=340359 RepID=UPI0025E931C6|nr:septum formation family protein [uncultured Leifsonia sp.]